MASGPPIRRRVSPRSPATGPLSRKAGGRPPAGPTDASPNRARQRRVLIVGAILVIVAVTVLGLQIERWSAPRARTPAEVQRIAQGLKASGHAIDRVARNASGGWSVVFDDGEVQWFKSPNRDESRLHPVRVMFGVRPDPNIVVLELHATVFAVVMSGRRQGETLELGTAPTSAEQIATKVRAVVSGRGR